MPAASRHCAISSSTRASTLPVRVFAAQDQSAWFTHTGAGAVALRRMNSDSTPTRKDTPAWSYASLAV